MLRSTPSTEAWARRVALAGAGPSADAALEAAARAERLEGVEVDALLSAAQHLCQRGAAPPQGGARGELDGEALAAALGRALRHSATLVRKQQEEEDAEDAAALTALEQLAHVCGTMLLEAALTGAAGGVVQAAHACLLAICMRSSRDSDLHLALGDVSAHAGDCVRVGALACVLPRCLRAKSPSTLAPPLLLIMSLQVVKQVVVGWQVPRHSAGGGEAQSRSTGHALTHQQLVGEGELFPALVLAEHAKPAA